MADYEVSKLMWVAIVVALAASIFVIAKPQINTLANEVFGKVSTVVDKTKTGNEIVDPASVLIYSSSNGGGTIGFSSSAYEDGVLKPGLTNLKVPEIIDGKPVKTIDFTNSTSRWSEGFKGVIKIVAGPNIDRITPFPDSDDEWGDFELDLTEAKITKFDQYTFAGSTSLKKIRMPKTINTFGYGIFNKGVLNKKDPGIKEITFTSDNPIDGIEYLSAIPKGQLTINIPKSMEAWFTTNPQASKLYQTATINVY